MVMHLTLPPSLLHLFVPPTALPHEVIACYYPAQALLSEKHEPRNRLTLNELVSCKLLPMNSQTSKISPDLN